MCSSAFVTATRTPARPEHARELREAAVEVGDVEEHPRRDDAVERRVRERRSCTSPTCASTPRARASSTIRGDCRPDDVAPELVADPRGELARPPPTSSTAADASADRLEGDVPRVGHRAS